MSNDVGKKIKELRTSKGLTLKELSEKTNLSTGFLSQLERGLTTVAVDSLENIAETLGVDLAYFFKISTRKRNSIIRSYEREVFSIEDSKFIQYNLSNSLKDKSILPRLVEILPSNRHEDVEPYQHQGEEFIFVLEGILTLYINKERHELHPGDSAHISSTIVHNWANYTNRNVKLIAVNTPNKFRTSEI